MSILRKILSKPGRAAIYGLAIAVLTLAGVVGIVSAEEQEQYSASIASFLAAVAPILALFNLSDDKPVE